MQVKEVVKITEKIKMDDLHEYKVNWSDADLEKLIEDKIVIKLEWDDRFRYTTFDGAVRWYEWAIPDEELRPFFKREDGTFDGMIIRIKMTWEQRNRETRNKNLLRWKYRRLQNLAFEEKILDRKGRPCRECKSTNTTLSGSVNYHGGGYHSSATRQCLDCGHFEITGARF
tara:strand:- start:1062 stop:1574 length:513 start_codon:yes stop_codon:yes gene_type:complete